jgi:Trypsin-like peptidase domain/Colicin V production protein
MTTLDWAIVAFTCLLAVLGWLRGFIVGAFALAGFAAGALLGARVAPLLLPAGSSSPYAPLFGLAGALLVGGLLASGLERLGVRLRNGVRLQALGVLDGALGAALTAAVALGIVWLAGAVALQTPGAGNLRREIQRSAVLQRLNAALPPSGPLLNALARFDPLPSVPGPDANVPPPAGSVLRQPGVRQATTSVVKVLGTACGLGIEGSGWIAPGGFVVTNAHVVAGEHDTGVEVGGSGAARAARVVHFDPRNDVAVLSAGDLGVTALRLAPSPHAGTSGAILGYPNNAPRIDAEPARIGATRTVLSDDAYGSGPIQRSVTTLRGLVRSGNSGGPVVDTHGRVLATVFAATTSGPPGGFGVPNAIVGGALAAARSASAVSTGPCAR